MLFRIDETKEEREAREDLFGSKLSVPADQTMEVDRPPTPTQNDPLFIPIKQGLSIQEPKEIPRPSLAPAPVQPTLAQPAAAPVKMFGVGTNLGISGFSSPAEPSADAPVTSTTSTAPLPAESRQDPLLSSTPLIRTGAAPEASTSGGSTSATAMPSVWRGAAAEEGEDEDEEMPEINIESDSE